MLRPVILEIRAGEVGSVRDRASSQNRANRAIAGESWRRTGSSLPLRISSRRPPKIGAVIYYFSAKKASMVYVDLAARRLPGVRIPSTLLAVTRESMVSEAKKASMVYVGLGGPPL